MYKEDLYEKIRQGDHIMFIWFKKMINFLMYGTQLVLMGVTQYKMQKDHSKMNTNLEKMMIVDCSDPVINYEI